MNIYMEDLPSDSEILDLNVAGGTCVVSLLTHNATTIELIFTGLVGIIAFNEIWGAVVEGVVVKDGSNFVKLLEDKMDALQKKKGLSSFRFVTGFDEVLLEVVATDFEVERRPSGI